MTTMLALLMAGVVGFEILAVIILAFMRAHQVTEEVGTGEEGHEGVPAADLESVIGVNNNNARMFAIHVGGDECEHWFLTIQPGARASEVLAPYPQILERGWVYLEEINEESPVRMAVSADDSDVLELSDPAIEFVEFSICGPSPDDSFATSDSVLVGFIAQEFASASYSNKSEAELYQEVSRRVMTVIGLPVTVEKVRLSESSI